MADLFDNPMGLMGFEFVEFASPDARTCWSRCSRRWASRWWPGTARKDVVLYRQGDINFIVNREPKSLAGYFAAEHGPSACGWPSACGIRTRPTTARWSSARSRSTCPPARWSCGCRRSRASAARRCT